MTKLDKIKLILIIIIATIGALYIYNNFKSKENKEIITDKFLLEYNQLNENHIFKNKNSSEIYNILNNETGIVFFCNSSSSWCQTYAKLLDETARSNNVEVIYHNDIKEDRNINSNNYRRIVKYLAEFLDSDDANNKRLNMPCTVFIKNGKIIALDKTTSLISSDIETNEYWTKEHIREFKNQINENIYKINNDVVETKEEL